MYDFVGCLGVEFVQFQGLHLEASDDLFYQFSLKGVDSFRSLQV